MEKAKDADAFAFSLDGSATFAIVRNKGDFLKKIRGSGCPHFFLITGYLRRRCYVHGMKERHAPDFFPKKKLPGTEPVGEMVTS